MNVFLLGVPSVFLRFGGRPTLRTGLASGESEALRLEGDLIAPAIPECSSLSLFAPRGKLQFMTAQGGDDGIV